MRENLFASKIGKHNSEECDAVRWHHFIVVMI
jgi:hypothetical protein